MVGKSNHLYKELLENQIIPEIKRENEEQLSMEELTQIVENLEEVVDEYTQKVDNSNDVNERNNFGVKENHRNKW